MGRMTKQNNVCHGIHSLIRSFWSPDLSDTSSDISMAEQLLKHYDVTDDVTKVQGTKIDMFWNKHNAELQQTDPGYQGPYNPTLCSKWIIIYYFHRFS